MSDVIEAGSDTDTGTEGTQTEATETEGSILTGEQSTESEGSEAAEGEVQAEGEGGEQAEEQEAPETYEFNMPEGVEMNEGLAEAVTPIFKELKLSQEQAGKLTEAYASAIQEQAQASQDAFAKQLDDWKTELKNDAAFGGEKFDENSGMVSQFIQKTVPAEIKDDVMSLFVSTGAGNHPGLVKYFHHLAQTFPVGEDQPGSGQHVPNRGKSVEERMYPNQ